MLDHAPQTRTALMLLRGVEIDFLGFRSDVSTLMHHGWEIRSAHDVYSRSISVAFLHTKFNLCGFMKDYDFMEKGFRGVFQIGPMSTMDAMARMVDVPIYKVMRPHAEESLLFINEKMIRIKDLFQIEEEEKIPQLIVDPNDIQNMMERIVELQRPKQAELRDQAMNAVKFTEAKIISFSSIGKK